MKVIRSFALGAVITAFTALSVFGSPGEIVARGDGIVVTEVEMQAMQKTFKGGSHPTRKGLLEGTVRMVLFAAEALREKIDCPSAAEAVGFTRTIVLASCYLHARLDALDVREGAVESYYRAKWRQFMDQETGELMVLDAALRQRIRKQILAAKKKYLGTQEYSRLCKVYNIVLVESGS